MGALCPCSRARCFLGLSIAAPFKGRDGVGVPGLVLGRHPQLPGCPSACIRAPACSLSTTTAQGRSGQGSGGSRSLALGACGPCGDKGQGSCPPGTAPAPLPGPTTSVLGCLNGLLPRKVVPVALPVFSRPVPPARRARGEGDQGATAWGPGLEAPFVGISGSPG